MAIRACLTPSMRGDPFFSVVLSTYKRGRCIAPTIESVLQQTFSDFELIVVGDHCEDDTEAAVAAFKSERISWRNLEYNSGSQAFPNNEGIRCARGAWICYIGHDDVWSPGHLAALHELVRREDADFVVSGCINYGPPDSEANAVTGIFNQSRPKFLHFYPPSSFAHRRDVVERIGKWRDPRSISAPVDCDLLLRASRSGMRFAFTGRVTVHKFAAAHRYLSYLRPSDEEQRAVLRTFGSENESRMAHLIAHAERAGTFLTLRCLYYSCFGSGYVFNRSRSSRGLNRLPLRLLTQRAVIEQTAEMRGLDWHGLERRRFRWSGPNPRPKILIPFSGNRAQVAIEIAGLAPGARPEDLSVMVEEQKVDHTLERDTAGSQWLRFVAPLKRHDYTIVTLHTPSMVSRRSISGRRRRLGLAAGRIVLDPLP